MPPDPQVVPRYHKTRKPINESGGKHQWHEHGLRPSVKGIASDDQNDIPPALRAAMEREIEPQGGGQEIEKKNVRTEYHVGR